MPGAIIIPESSQTASTISPTKLITSPKRNSFQISSQLDETDPHCFIPPTADSSRAPCPALNALANHGYLPRSGRQISFTDIITALEQGFGLSPGFAFFMAVGSFTLLRRWFRHPFDLHETAIHNLIEHNASLVHDDADPNAVRCDGTEYAPIKVDPALMGRFLNIACPLHPGADDVFTTSLIAQYRVARETETKTPLDALHAELGRAEFSMIIQIFGKQDEQGKWYVDENLVAEFFTNERFPDGWKPARVLHLIDAVRCSGDIRHKMEEIRRTDEKWLHPEALEDAQQENEWYCKVRRWFSAVLDLHCDPHTTLM